VAERRFSERTAWARNIAAPLRDFLRTETGGAVAERLGPESAVGSVSSKRATLCEDHSGTFERNRTKR
jgi:hypothetical protein